MGKKKLEILKHRALRADENLDTAHTLYEIARKEAEEAWELFHKYEKKLKESEK